MSVLPMRCSVKQLKLLPNRQKPMPRFVNVASLVAAAHQPGTIRRLIVDERFGKRTDTEFLEHPARTATETAAVARITRRLERVAESIAESEKRKFMAKLKGEVLSEEEMLLVETMTREIVGKFMEEPIKYLRSGRCCRRDFDDRINDLESLTKILEETCSGRT